MKDIINVNNVISITSVLIALIILWYTIHVDRRKNKNTQLKVVASLGGQLAEAKYERKLYRPIWVCVLGVPKFNKDNILITIPLIIRNDSLVPLRNIEFNIYYPMKYSTSSSTDKFISNMSNEVSYPNDRIKRFEGEYFNDLVKVSFFLDYISPLSFLTISEAICVSKYDLENGFNVDKEIFKNNEKVVYFPLQFQLFAENYKPIFSESHIFISHSNDLKDLQKLYGDPLSMLLAKETYNPFAKLKPGIHFLPFPLLFILKRKFYKYSFLMGQIVLGMLPDKTHKSFIFCEALIETTIAYGDMRYLIQQTKHPNIIEIIKHIFKKKNMKAP